MNDATDSAVDRQIDPKTDTHDRLAFRAPGAQIYGDVRFAEGASVWPNAVLRAETEFIEVGAYTNIQDLSMIHVGFAHPTVIGEWCSITHHCTIHGARIGDNCLIGIGATLMDGVVLGDNCIVAGHAILTEGTEIPSNSVVAGVPGKVVAERDNRVANRMNAFAYHQNAVAYAAGNHRRWSEPSFRELMQQEQRRLLGVVA